MCECEDMNSKEYMHCMDNTYLPYMPYPNCCMPNVDTEQSHYMHNYHCCQSMPMNPVLATAYIPFQCNFKVSGYCEGFKAGTIFPDLIQKPYPCPFDNICCEEDKLYE